MAEDTTATTTDTTTTAATATTTAATAIAAPPWHGLTEPADIAWIENKGWTGASDAVQGYRGAEKLIGRDPSTLLAIPRADDIAGQRAVFAKLGMPDSADKYEFATAAGVKTDENYVAFAKDAFHKIGLTTAQAKDLTTQHNAYVTGVLAKQEADYNIHLASDKAALLAEWRGGHERQVNAAQSAAKALGFTPEMIDAVERTTGYASTMKFFAALGQKMGEDGFVSGEGKSFDGALTPEQAKVEIAKLDADPIARAALSDKAHPANKITQQKRTSLFQIAYP